MDVDEALSDALVREVLVVWRTVLPWLETAPPFAGGVWDDWPAAVTEGLALCRAEARAVLDFMRWEERRRG